MRKLLDLNHLFTTGIPLNFEPLIRRCTNISIPHFAVVSFLISVLCTSPEGARVSKYNLVKVDEIKIVLKNFLGRITWQNNWNSLAQIATHKLCLSPDYVVLNTDTFQNSHALKKWSIWKSVSMSFIRDAIEKYFDELDERFNERKLCSLNYGFSFFCSNQGRWNKYTIYKKWRFATVKGIFGWALTIICGMRPNGRWIFMRSLIYQVRNILGVLDISF